MVKQRKFWSWILILFLVIAVQFIHVGNADAAVNDWLEEQRFITDVWKIVNRSYVDDTFNGQDWYRVRKQFAGKKFDTREDTYTAVQEMLTSLGDPFTRLLKPEQFSSMKTSTTGALTGVGLQIAIDPVRKSVVVVSPIEGSPAERAGLRSLDRIVKIDGQPTEELTLDECANLMRGDIGTQVRLAVERLAEPEVAATLASKSTAKPIPGNDIQIQPLKSSQKSSDRAKDGKEPIEENFEVTIVRDLIEVNPVIAKLNKENGRKVGYLRLNQFNGNASAEMKRAIANLEAQGAEQYVLDLRGNPGGLLSAGIEIARMWLPKGVIVYTANRFGVQDSYAADGGALTNDPLVVLINGGTASASEILSGALHDNHRATLLGTRTFGKGLIQSLVDLGDGAGLAVTIAKYETPNHSDINKVGISPDVEVPMEKPIERKQLGTKDDPQYLAAIKFLESGSKFDAETKTLEANAA